MRIVMKATIIGISLCACLLGAAGISVLIQERRAGKFLDEMRALALGTPEFNDVLRIKAAFGGTVPGNCDLKACEVYFEFSNRWVSHLHLIPSTFVRTRIEVVDGHVRSIEFTESTRKQGVSYTAHTLQLWCATCPATVPTYDVISHASPTGTPMQVTVLLTSAATDQQRMSAYNYDVSCLSRIRGCENAHSLFRVQK